MRYLQITVRFLDERYHGLLARSGPPEWPPSPFRMFSALVAGAAQRNELENGAGDALCWLQGLCRERPPMIIAPRSRTGNAIVRYGPDNDDKFHSNPEACRSAKPTMPTLMLLEPDAEPEVHYLWDVAEIVNAPIGYLRKAARHLTRLGWGIDMAFADARFVHRSEIQSLKGIRWHPKPGLWREVGMLRVPTVDKDVGDDTLSDLKHCHGAALSRLEHGEARKHANKPRVFDRVFYSSLERPIGRPYAVFELRQDNGSFCRYLQRKLVHIAGMVRHLAKELMLKSPPSDVGENWVERYVVGHRDRNTEEHRQFSYLPLPSIGDEYADQSVRRVMIAAPVGDDAWLEHLADRLAGRQLRPENGNEFGEQQPPTLVRVYRDKVAQRYTGAANQWASVTPVILPGHDDRKRAKTRKLIEAALVQSGIEQPCGYEWSAFSGFRNSLSAHKYDRNKGANFYLPPYLQSRSVIHLTLTFKDELKVPGPLVIGAGRHCGFGLMAAAM